MRKSMNTQIDHACMRSKTNIRSDHDARKYVPGWRTKYALSRGGLVNQYRMNMYVSQSKTNQSRRTIKSINQSIDHKIIYVGPHQNPFILHEPNL